MKKSYQRQIVNREVSLSKRAKKDKISTLSTRELEVDAPQGSWWRVTLAGYVEVDAFSNRKDGTSLTIRDSHLPRFVDLPKLGSTSPVIVRSVKRQY